MRVLDFGIAKVSEVDDSKLTATGSSIGTLHYMAPEQTLESKRVDPKADVWSLGIALFEMLSGAGPFEDCGSLAELHVAINTRDVRSVQELAPWVEPNLAIALHGALIRDAGLRCPTVTDLAEVLAPFARSSDDLDAGLLVPLPDRVRQTQQEQVALPKRWQRVLPSTPELALDATVADDFLGQKLGGRYELLWKLGAGGMGAVYEGLGPDGNRYAVKVIPAELADSKSGALSRFVREARMVASLDHPNVVRVFDADTDVRGESPFIVMELLRGTDLDTRIKRHGPLRPATAARIVLEACRGLSAAHEKGLVHRDIKPANLFLHELPSGEVVVKVCDFGIAKQIGSESDAASTNLTRTGGVMGSPMYTSPEQAKNAKQVDTRTDVWSLGISLYEALVGEPPWAGRSTVAESMLASYTEAIPHAQDRAPWVPPGLVEVLHKALARRLDERFASMHEFAAALEPFARGCTSLTGEALAPVDARLRAQTAERARSPELSSLGGGAVATMPSAPAEKPPRRGALVAAGLTLALAAAAAGVYLLRSDKPEAAELTSAAASSAPSSAVATVGSASIAITPRDATVTVDGKAASLDDGRLVLRGEAGDAFKVVVAAAGGTVERTVVLRKDGTANPDAIDAPTAVAETTSTPLSASARPMSGKGTLPAGGPAQTGTTATPTGAPPPAAPAAPAPAKPGGKPGLDLRDNW